MFWPITERLVITTPPIPKNRYPEKFIIIVLAICFKMLSKQIETQLSTFREEGGFTEALTAGAQEPYAVLSNGNTVLIK